MDDSVILQPDKRILGIDYGKKYVGVAVSDPLLFSAQGLEIIKRQKPDKQRQTLKRLKEICDELSVQAVVVGFPMNLDGSNNERCEYTIQFCDLLYKRVNLPIFLWDERLTTVSAQRTMEELGLKDEKAYVDEIAAMIILQGFLDARANGNTPRPYKD